jgi:CBS domain-containing protein
MADPSNPVREVMSRGAISIDEKMTLRGLAAVLAELDVGTVLVARADASASIVSERDVVRALANGADADEVWAADIAIDDLVLAEPEEPIVDVARRMGDEHVRHVAVVERGTIVGIVSARDIIPPLADYARATL